MKTNMLHIPAIFPIRHAVPPADPVPSRSQIHLSQQIHGFFLFSHCQQRNAGKCFHFGYSGRTAQRDLSIIRYTFRCHRNPAAFCPQIHGCSKDHIFITLCFPVCRYIRLKRFSWKTESELSASDTSAFPGEICSGSFSILNATLFYIQLHQDRHLH